MTDVCIIYAREDKSLVSHLDKLLRDTGREVWWDEYLHEGQFPRQIEEQLTNAGCVIVVWSNSSRDKDWVRDEARYARDNHRPVIQLMLDKIIIPVGHGQNETIALLNWTGSPKHAGFNRLVHKVNQILGVPKLKWDGRRPGALTFGGKSLALPCFFRSVSSYETQLRPDAATKALELMNTESVLASAYDLTSKKDSKRITAALRRMRRKGSVILLDSGNYESYRKSDKRWNVKRFHNVIRSDCFDFAFCYDNLKPPASVTRNVSDVARRVHRDQRASRHGRILPIVHIPVRNGEFNTAVAPNLFVGLAQALRPAVIAVPERELGSGVIEKARVIWKIRKRLNELGYYQPIHLLGTGNPLSLAIFAAAGADSFDGLEWCRTTTDFESALLYHFQQYDFFQNQTRSAETPLVRLAADATEVSYNARVAFHNLEFFRVWIRDIQKHLAQGRIDRLLITLLPKGVFQELQRTLPEVFE